MTADQAIVNIALLVLYLNDGGWIDETNIHNLPLEKLELAGLHLVGVPVVITKLVWRDLNPLHIQLHLYICLLLGHLVLQHLSD